MAQWPVDLDNVARRARDALRKLANQRRVSVLISSSDVPVTLTANPVEMEQILVNLITNAIHASEPSGWVNVGLAASAETVRLTVADRGCGMTEEQIQRMFDPFYSTRRQDGGVGLGLSMVYGIVKKQGGTIDVSSSPGQGTTLTISLPRNLSPGEKPAP